VHVDLGVVVALVAQVLEEGFVQDLVAVTAAEQDLLDDVVVLIGPALLCRSSSLVRVTALLPSLLSRLLDEALPEVALDLVDEVAVAAVAREVGVCGSTGCPDC
jgi:hypothetical protein